KDGPVVQVKNSSNKIELGEDVDDNVIYDGPLTVMINRFSASASEIFAGAIQDYGRGVVLGETSFGKGTVQSVIDLGRYLNVPEGEKVGQLKLTLQKFYRITGSSTQHKGVDPDINFPSAFSAEEFGESSRPSALPWDQIKGTKYKPTEQVTEKMLAEVSKEYRDRLENDRHLKDLISETEELKKSISTTRISLNKEERQKEIAEAEKRRTEQSAMEGTKIGKEGIYEVNNIDVDDKYLREGLVVLSDIVSAIG
ncbi:MAG: carboxy terminal-processing peptidase, partial [Fulvivirga sp.]|uniref:carboxy terminal-processing peptidase n=1 Tax=Fulvivirga sp. TaxID=1931237 RepID=UPI0032EF3FDE